MRATIGAKIFAIAVALIVLMFVVSGASLLLAHTIARDLEVQSAVLLPLNDQVAEIASDILEREVLVQRLRRPTGATPSDTETVANLDAEIAAEFGVADDLLSRHRVDWFTAESLVIVSRAEAALAALKRDFANYQADSARLLDPINSAEFVYLSTLVDREEDDLQIALDSLRRDIASFAEEELEETLARERTLAALIVLVTAIGALVGLLIAWLITRRIVTPLLTLLGVVRAVEGGDLRADAKVRSGDEVGDLAKGFNAMVAGLRQKERITETFGRYVDPRVVSKLIENPELSLPGGDRRTMTVFFSDIVDFTSIAERLTPASLVTLLNAYLNDMAEPIAREGGMIDKFIGDAVMAYWGPPFVEADLQAAAACRAALAQIERLPRFNARVPEIIGLRVDAPKIGVRIGLATGPVVVGAIGSETTQNYTVIGDTVNLAARLEGACRIYDLPILADEGVRDAASDIAFREIDTLRVKGKEETTTVFQPLNGAASPALLDAYAEALAAFHAFDLDKAARAFERSAEAAPDDGPTRVMLDRIAELRRSPKPETWDGVWTLSAK